MKSKIIKSKDMYQGSHLRLKEIEWVDKNENKRKWEAVERINSKDIVSIVAMTNEEKVVLISQFRPPVGKEVIELPAGLCDLKDEKIFETAARELQEETGYRADMMQKIYAGTISSGLSCEYLHVFFATELEFVGKKQGKEEEAITVYEVSIKEIDKWLETKENEGFLTDVKIRGHISYIEKILKR